METVRSGITVNATQNYVYDERNQLTSATKPMGTGTETFTYDGTGNRLQRDGETTNSTFDDVNRLLNDKKFTYEYDNNGNLLKKTGTDTGEVAQFAWDHRNRLVGVVIKPGENAAPTSTISYKYDAFNRRIEKDVNGTTTRYVYDRGNIHLEYDGNNTFQAKYVHTDNVDEAVMMIRPENPYRNAKFPVQEFYYHRDRLGNITEITDFEGTVVQRYVYDAFGKVSIFDKDGNAITPDSAKYLKSPYAFTGREYDHETGCYYYRNRYYCPDMARYISEDPIGFAGLDENLYRYVGNNSVNFKDPSGEIFAHLGLCGLAVGLGGAYDTIQNYRNSVDVRERINKRFRDIFHGDQCGGEYDPDESIRNSLESYKFLTESLFSAAAESVADAYSFGRGQLAGLGYCFHGPLLAGAVFLGAFIFDNI